MKRFEFTKKKFLSLSDTGRRTHVIAWLSIIYQKLGTGRTTTTQCQDFAQQYKIILDWMGMPWYAPPVSDSTRTWLVYVSDAIQAHRAASGKGLRDYDLLDKVMTEDGKSHAPAPPVMDYQVALDGLRSLFNVGSIFRTCEGAGIQTIILGNCLGKKSPQVRKTAMGTQDRIIEEPTQDLALVLADKKKEGFRIICVETIEGSLPCHEYQWPKKAVIIMGNEEYGISPHVLCAMDDAVHIPMFGEKNSLNVANALSVVLYQAVFYHLVNPMYYR